MSRVALLSVLISLTTTIHAQKKPASTLCTRDYAADTTKQQILVTRTFDNVVQRIAVLLRAADLLWPHEQDKAMAAFMEAFDLAVQNFKEHGDQITRASQSKFAAIIPLPDQRFKVISAIAKRDPATAQKLSEKILQEHARDAADKPAANDASKTRIAEKILTVYYWHAQALITDKNLGEARRFASKVTELDQRAYLSTRIAEESLKVAADQTEARHLLNEVAAAIAKAPKTIVSARALLALAYLYAKIDTNRGVEELGNAVKTINILESPDFSQQFVMMKIEGKTFGSYASFATPGFNPENAFREMGKLDFDGSLAQATSFSDKSLRALTTLSVIEPCFATKKRQNTN